MLIAIFIIIHILAVVFIVQGIIDGYKEHKGKFLIEVLKGFMIPVLVVLVRIMLLGKI